ncbi:MAG TPA: DNA repair protein RecO [Candidatus Saccharimonadales bacterium]|nr:DNA repair protein RecO [Candidatus Saccharimonadales bacterium]
MRQLVTQAIVLTRTDYGEADRIITLLTPDQGKLRLLAKGVRRIKSKLAGGIELFSVSTITFVRGRGEIGTLVSARLEDHYSHIVEDLDRTMLGYELLKIVHKNTEDEPEDSYFTLLKQSFQGLDDTSTPLSTVRFWFFAQMLRLSGQAPNLSTDSMGQTLKGKGPYIFNFEYMCFDAHTQGPFSVNHIKFLRLAFAAYPLTLLANIEGSVQFVDKLQAILLTMFRTAQIRE